MKRIIALLLVLAMIALTACSGSNSATSQADDEMKIITIAKNEEIVYSWDPAIAYGSEDVFFCNIYETLLRYNYNTKGYDKILVTDYTKSPDGLVWTFKLREGVKFHDGTDFNAEAVKFSIDRNKNMQQGAAYIWDPVKDIQVIDDYTVQFTLSYTVDFEEVVSCQYDAFIYSPTAVGDDMKAATEWFSKNNEAGTGPYMLQSYTQGSGAVLTKFDGYWGGWEGDHFDKIAFKVATENSSRRQMVESGDVDVALQMTPEDAEALQSNPELKILVNSAAKNEVAYLNTKKAPLDNKLVRQALAYSYPYEDVIKYLKKGKYGSVATDVLAPAILRGATESIPYTYDVNKTKELLQQAGYPNGGLTLTVTYNTVSDDLKKILEFWKSRLSEVGITLDLQAMSWDAWYSQAKDPDASKRPDISAVELWSDTMTSMGVYGSGVMTDASWNFSGFSDKTIDEELAKAYGETAFDKEKSTQMLQEVGKKVAEECFTINMCDMKDITIVNSKIEGYEFNPAYVNVFFVYNLSEK